jgi:hypothetical protein
VRESCYEELDRREYSGRRNIGFGSHCWANRSDLFCRFGNTSRAPQSPMGVLDLRQSHLLDTPFTTKS